MVLEGLFESIGISSLQGTLFGVGIIVVLVIIVISVIRHKGKGIGGSDEEHALKRQRRLERKERRRERKEMKQFLNEDVLVQKLKHSEKDLMIFKKNINTNLGRLWAVLGSLLHFFEKYTQNHDASIIKKIKEGVEIVLEYLDAFGKLFEIELKVLNQDKELLKDIAERPKKENDELSKELKIVKKEYYLLKKVYKERERPFRITLHPVKFEAILNNRIGLIHKLQSINNTFISGAKRENAETEIREHTLNTISDQTKDFHDTLDSHKNDVTKELIKRIQEWFVANKNNVLRSVSYNSTLAEFIELFNKKMAEKAELYKQKEILDAEYTHFIAEGQAALKETRKKAA